MILVTGITGRSGKWFLDKLSQENESIKNLHFRAAIRNPIKIKEIDHSKFNLEFAIGDLEDENFLDKSMKGIDTVLHIAGIGRSEKIARAAAKNQVKWLILVHTTGIFSKYKSATKEYFRIEENIKRIIEKKEIDLTYIRPTMIYGSVNDRNIVIFIKMVNRLRFFPIVNHGRYELQPVHAKDLGTSYYDILINKEKTTNKEYVLSGKEPIYFIDILRLIAKHLNRKLSFIHIPFNFAYFLAFVLYLISFRKFDYREKVQRLIEPRAYPHHHASNDFGYSPISFEEGIETEVLEFINLKRNK